MRVDLAQHVPPGELTRFRDAAADEKYDTVPLTPGGEIEL